MSYIKIPEAVEFSENLSPMAKLLFGRIWSLSQKEGYCWATNQHFADLYKVKVWSISNWISELNKEGFIWIEGQGKIRKISILTDVKKHKDTCENSQANHVKIHTKPCENSQVNMNKINKNNKEEEKEKEVSQNSLSPCFDFFKSVSDAFFTASCTKKEPTKYKRNFAALANIALGLSDSTVLSEKTILQYNASQNEINAINGEIKALQGSLDYFDKIRDKAVKNSKDGYIPRLLEKIINNEEYKTPEIVKENAIKVSAKNSNAGQHQQDPPQKGFGERCAEILNLPKFDAVQIAHRIADRLNIRHDEILIKAVSGFANWGKSENIIITNHEDIGVVVYQFAEYIKAKNSNGTTKK